jgi:hypothetical protein
MAATLLVWAGRRYQGGRGYLGACAMSDRELDEATAEVASLVEGPRAIPIRFTQSADIEIRLVNDVVVNFTGDEFLVSFSQSLPPVFRGAEEFPEEIVAKVLFRAALTPRKWAEITDAMADQVERLRRAGILPERKAAEKSL